MTDTPTSRGSVPRSGTMRTREIVFLVLAGVAPLGVIVATVSLSVALGVGPAVPATFLIAAVILGLFAAGYVHMSRRIVNVGGFYTYARAGLGEIPAGAAAWVALVAYNAATIGILGGLGYFAHQVALSVFDIDIAWQWWALVAFAAAALLSYFDISVGARLLGLLLVAEVALILVFDVSVLLENGFEGFSLSVFSPDNVFSGGFGISLMFAFTAFVGFEATALYGSEARDARRSVPRATYISLTCIAVFYVLTTWAAVTAFGVDQVRGVAAADPGVFFFAANAQYVGGFTNDAIQVLLVGSMFAAFLAFHWNTARYGLGLAREGMLPGVLAFQHPRHGSPIAATTTQLGITAMALVATSISGVNPYLGMGASVFGLATLAIVLLQAIASVSIVAYFLRHRENEPMSTAVVAPALGALGLVAALILMVQHYSLLSGGADSVLRYLPWLLPVAVVIGCGVSVVQRTQSGRPGDVAVRAR